MGRPSDVCHGARIECASGGHACGVFMPEHPLHGRNFGVVGTVTSLVDLWADTGRRPRYMRQGRTGLAWPRLRRTCRTACMPRHGQPGLSLAWLCRCRDASAATVWVMVAGIPRAADG